MSHLDISCETAPQYLLLAGTDALGVEVPVRVEVADGHPQVLHSDHGAVGQVWEEEGSRWCELAQGGCGP